MVSNEVLPYWCFDLQKRAPRYPLGMAHPARRSDGALATFGRKAVAWVVLVGAIILGLKLVGGILIGFIQTVLTLLMVVFVAAGVIWALRRL